MGSLIKIFGLTQGGRLLGMHRRSDVGLLRSCAEQAAGAGPSGWGLSDGQLATGATGPRRGQGRPTEGASPAGAREPPPSAVSPETTIRLDYQQIDAQLERECAHAVVAKFAYGGFCSRKGHKLNANVVHASSRLFLTLPFWSMDSQWAGGATARRCRCNSREGWLVIAAARD